MAQEMEPRMKFVLAWSSEDRDHFNISTCSCYKHQSRVGVQEAGKRKNLTTPEVTAELSLSTASQVDRAVMDEMSEALAEGLEWGDRLG